MPILSEYCQIVEGEGRKSLPAAWPLASPALRASDRVGSGAAKQHEILASSFLQMSCNLIVMILERALCNEGLTWVE